MTSVVQDKEVPSGPLTQQRAEAGYPAQLTSSESSPAPFRRVDDRGILGKSVPSPLTLELCDLGQVAQPL